MELYGRQIRPILHILIEKGGVQHIDPEGSFFERAIARAMLSRFPLENNEAYSPQGPS